jgi:hypothetical protein
MADVFDNKVPKTMARRFVVSHSLDACARLVLAHEKTPEHSPHAADGLGRGLA